MTAGGVTGKLIAWLGGASSEPEADRGGGQALSDFVDGELEDERSRRVVIEARGTALITTSTALATLAFAAAALVTGQDGYAPPRMALWALFATFAAFMVAAFCGLRVAKSAPTEVVTTEQMLEWRDDDETIWHNTKDNVVWLLTRAKIIEVDSLRLGSNEKMRWARIGGRAQVVALAGLAVAVSVILAKAIWPGLDAGGLFVPAG